MVSFFFFLLSSLQYNHTSQVWKLLSLKTFFMVQRHPAKGQENFWKHPERVSSKIILKQKDGNYCGNKGKEDWRKPLPDREFVTAHFCKHIKWKKLIFVTAACRVSDYLIIIDKAFFGPEELTVGFWWLMIM